MFRRHWATAVFVVALVAILMTGCSAPKSGPAPAAHPEVTVTVLMNPPENVAYIGIQGYADMLRKKHPWLRLSVLATEGYIYNLKVMVEEPAKRKDTIWGENGGLKAAKNKLAPFTEGFKGCVPKRLWMDYGWWGLWMTSDPKNIKTVHDLAGKRVANPPTGGGANQWLEAMLKGQGVFDKLAALDHVGWGNMHELMIDGRVAASSAVTFGNPITGVNLPLDMIVQGSALAKAFGYVSAARNEAELAKALAATGFDDVMSPLTVKAGSLLKQEQDVIVGNGLTYVDADATFPEDVAYELVKTRIEYNEELKQYGGLLKIYSPEHFVFGLKPADIHPGALKAYKEKGLIK